MLNTEPLPLDSFTAMASSHDTANVTLAHQLRTWTTLPKLSLQCLLAKAATFIFVVDVEQAGIPKDASPLRPDGQ